jgi:hypothetical protein
VVLLRQAHAAIGPQWALLRLRVSLDSAPAVGLANVLVRLTTAVAPAPVQGMTDRHGEAVLAVIGAPLLVGLKREFSATLRLRLDRAVVARSDTKDIAVPDPDLIESRAADGVTGVATVDGGTVQLAAGREARMVLAAALP